MHVGAQRFERRSRGESFLLGRFVRGGEALLVIGLEALKVGARRVERCTGGGHFLGR
jgi:hypothetical protein